MAKLQVGIIGLSGIARLAHLPGWSENEYVEIRAICDINSEVLNKVSEEYQIPETYQNYREMIADREIDVIDICTPNYLHSQIAIDALNHNKHVLCEKPDAVNVAEVLQMKKASEKTDKLLMVMRNNRFLKSAQFLKQYIEGDKLGEIYAAKCGWIRKRGVPTRGGWFTTKAKSGGGPLIDLGVHMIDLAIWLMGNPRPVSVVGSVYNKFTEFKNKNISKEVDAGTFDVEDMANGYIKFENGASLLLEFSWASHIKEGDRYFELMGTKAGAQFHSKDNQLQIFGDFEGSTIDMSFDIEGDGNFQEHRRNINHFVDCIIKGETPSFTPEQGVDMIKILEGLYQSAETGNEVKL